MNQRIAAIMIALVLFLLTLWVVVRLTRYSMLQREATNALVLLDRWKQEVCIVTGDHSFCFPIRR